MKTKLSHSLLLLLAAAPLALAQIPAGLPGESPGATPAAADPGALPPGPETPARSPLSPVGPPPEVAGLEPIAGTGGAPAAVAAEGVAGLSSVPPAAAAAGAEEAAPPVAGAPVPGSARIAPGKTPPPLPAPSLPRTATPPPVPPPPVPAVPRIAEATPPPAATTQHHQNYLLKRFPNDPNALSAEGYPPGAESMIAPGRMAVPTPAARGEQVIRDIKMKVLQRHYEAALSEALESERASLFASGPEKESLASKAKALRDFAAKLESDILAFPEPRTAAIHDGRNPMGVSVYGVRAGAGSAPAHDYSHGVEGSSHTVPAPARIRSSANRVEVHEGSGPPSATLHRSH